MTGCDPGFRPAQTPLRPASYCSPASRLRPIPRIQGRQISVRHYKKQSKKPLCCNTLKRRKERLNFKVPAPASTLVSSPSLLSLAPVANRGQVSKSYFINSPLLGAPSLPQQPTVFSRRCTRRRTPFCGSPPRPVCRCDTIDHYGERLPPGLAVRTSSGRAGEPGGGAR